MLYPANMEQHGPARSMEEYLAWLNDELDEADPASPRAYDLRTRIRALEDEIGAGEAA
jgi:hypothetical protein